LKREIYANSDNQYGLKMNSIVKLKTLEEWEELKKDLTEKTELIIFKYSPICGISTSVEDDFNAWYLNLSEDVKIKCAKVDVISARHVSQLIAKELEIQHQSPQLIWLNKDAKVKWSASHYDINKAQLSAQLKNED
jgi:bacillithiol system protein YtxJ